MERFKALEKEMKTKAFSKEGLIAATRLDPQEKAKLEARQTIEEFVDSLSRQIEQAEAEIEILQASSTGGRGKKSGKSSSAGNSEGRIAELERLNERRSWHISKLEAVMRLLENGKLSVEQVTELKEDVSYFVESNQVRSSIAGLEGLPAERVGVYVCLSRKRTLKRTKASMRTSTLMKKKMVWV